MTFYLLLAGVVLAPLAFWSSQYFALESVKTLVIGVLTFAALALVAAEALKTRSLKLPPRSIVTIGTLMAVSIILSASASGNFMKSFFGQGFEIGTGSFLITLLLAGIVAFVAISRRVERAVVLYMGMFGAFILVWLLQILRVLIGAQFISLGILGNVTSSIVGNWFSFGILSAVVAVISFAAIYFLRLSGKMKAAYWVLFALSAVSMFIVNSREVWQAATIVFLGLAIYLASQRQRPEGGAFGAFFKRLAWIPLVCFIVSLALAWQGLVIAGPVVTSLKAGYSELVMPWRMTMDVAAGELKESPVLGAGPNRFTKAFLTYKPSAINTTEAWGVEFNSGFGLIPTSLVTLGFFGYALWIVFFIFFGILGARSLRGLARAGGTGDMIAEPARPYARFVIVSSFAAASLLWITSILYVPSHAMVYFAYILTGVWLGSSAAYGRVRGLDLSPARGSGRFAVMTIAQAAVLLVAVLWGVTYIKNASALAYFGKGVRQLTVAVDPVAADRSFEKALSLNPLDIYWQARAEAGISNANKVLSAITSTTSAADSAEIVKKAGDIVNKSIEYTNNAIKLDPANYNNYLSQARVSELATAMKMQDAYASAVNAYTNAIRRNAGNPSLYLSLARLHASQNKLDEAIQAVGAALQVKSNYLDAVFLLSQVEAAKGNLADAVTAAQFATQLNPENPLLFFQLGLLQYNKADYAASADAFEKAVKLNPDYANAQYFLGLSYARLNKNADAIAQFEKLGSANPENQEVAVILQTLKAGKPLFGQGPQAQAARAEKKTSLPIKTK